MTKNGAFAYCLPDDLFGGPPASYLLLSAKIPARRFVWRVRPIHFYYVILQPSGIIKALYNFG
jgi:hypothetical protein